MSVIFDGHLPENCIECPCCQGDECWATTKRYQVPDVLNRRPDWCPAKNVPVHGRLIDADRLIAVIRSAAGKNNDIRVSLFDVIFQIEHAPTVLEADFKL